MDLSPKNIALSTVISQLPPLMIMAFTVLTRITLPGRGLFDALRSTIGEALHQALVRAAPSLVIPISLNIAQLVITSYYASISTEAVAALAYCRSLLLPVTSAGTNAMASAVQIRVSHYQGRADWRAADRCLTTSLTYWMPSILLTMFCGALLSRPLISLFSESQEILSYGRYILAAMCLSESFRSMNVVVFTSLRGSGDVAKSVWAALFSHWILAVGGGFVFDRELHLGLIGILAAVVLAEMCLSLFNLYRWKLTSLNMTSRLEAR